MVSETQPPGRTPLALSPLLFLSPLSCLQTVSCLRTRKAHLASKPGTPTFHFLPCLLAPLLSLLVHFGFSPDVSQSI